MLAAQIVRELRKAPEKRESEPDVEEATHSASDLLQDKRVLSFDPDLLPDPRRAMVVNKAVKSLSAHNWVSERPIEDSEPVYVLQGLPK